MIVEIAASSVSYDLHDKLNAYRRNAVREYVVWRVWDAAVDWFILRGGRFELLPLVDGIYKSEVFPGLWLEPAAVLRGDLLRLSSSSTGPLQPRTRRVCRAPGEFFVSLRSVPSGGCIPTASDAWHASGHAHPRDHAPTFDQRVPSLSRRPTASRWASSRITSRE